MNQAHKLVSTLMGCLLTMHVFSQTLRVKPLSSADDAEENISTGAIKLNSTDLELGGYEWDGAFRQVTGIRFPNVNLLQGATISKAYIQFSVDETNANNTNRASISIKAQKGNAATYTTDAKNITGRTYTNAQVTWAAPVWATLDQRLAAQQTPDVKSLIAEAIQTGWVSGNALAFSLSTTVNSYATVWAFDRPNSASHVPELVIEYTTPQQPPTSGKITNLFINEATGSKSAAYATDWVEIFNNNTSAVNLDSVYLTDSAKKPTKYSFKGKSLAAKAFLTILADGDLTVSTATTAALGIDSDGETLYLYQQLQGKLVLLDSLKIGATFYNTSAGRFPDASTTIKSFTKSSPTASNNSSKELYSLGFSNPRGVYTSAFNLTIQAPAGTTIRYTTNSTTPTATNGTVYGAPIAISGNAVIRAYAYNASGESKVITQTYVFPNSVAQQIALSATDVEKALKELPLVSISTTNSIETQTQSSCTFEYINKFGDGKSSFVDAGFNVFGYVSIREPKKSIRVYFKPQYGYNKLKHKIFERAPDENYDPTDEFDALDLRAGQDAAYGSNMNDYISHGIVRKMGSKDVHVRFVNVMFNGTYWGMFPLREKFDNDYASSYWGNTDDDYDYLKTTDVWYDWPVVSQVYVDAGASSLTQFQGVLASNTNRNYQEFKKRFDVTHFTNTMLMFLAGNAEPEYKAIIGKNYATPMTLLMKDMDMYMDPDGSIGYKENLSRNIKGPHGVFDMSGMGGATPILEYQTLVKDRFQLVYMENNGVMKPDNINVFLRQAQAIANASMVLETARWKRFTMATWNERISRTVTNMPTRIADVIARFRQFNCVHTLKAVTLSKVSGSSFSASEKIFITNPNANTTTYYTTDGTDVVFDNAISSTAKPYNAATGITLPVGQYKIRARAYTSGNFGMYADAQYTVTAAANTVTVSNLRATPQNTSVVLEWGNPTVVYDNLLIVAKESAGFTTKPNAATTYAADANFTGGGTAFEGGKVVYQGKGVSSLTVSNVSKGKTYYFAVYTRQGTVYTEGVQTTAVMPNTCDASGQLLVETWNNLPTTTNCVSIIPINTPPTRSQVVNMGVFESPTNQADNFGARYRGYICAPESGNYTFFFASDDGGELYLSTDANPNNKRRIAFIPNCLWTLPREWTKFPEQKSVLINLVAGQKYYVEALYKDGAGGDNLAVAWQKPSAPSVLEMIQGAILSPFSTTTPNALKTSLSFSAEAHQVGQAIELTWASNANKQADYYIIEKLDQKLAVFKPVEYVNAQYAQADFTLHQYTQLDKTPEIGDNMYRIGVILANRPPQYTEPMTVNFKPFELGELYPNPAIDVVHIDLSADANQPTTIHIVDIVGQVQLTKSFDRAPARTSLDIGHLPNGQYIVRIESKGKRAMVKKLMVFRE